ncbi:hypothetical protein QUB60_04315 [Microcoleus sp. A2-C5]|uniref:hypothetical protein n=1 Tax=unclassified Microcoleus TaxID=2642155 RepID=UPI002FD512AD
MTLDSIYFFLKAIWTNWPRQSLGFAVAGGRVNFWSIAPPVPNQPNITPAIESGCVQVLTYSYCCLRTANILPDRGICPDRSF